MKKFKLHWLGGKEEIVQGHDIADAFTKAGYGNGALPALDWYEELVEEDEDELDYDEGGRKRGISPWLLFV